MKYADDMKKWTTIDTYLKAILDHPPYKFTAKKVFAHVEAHRIVLSTGRGASRLTVLCTQEGGYITVAWPGPKVFDRTVIFKSRVPAYPTRNEITIFKAAIYKAIRAAMREGA